MSVLDVRPSGVELKGYAGDTISFYVNTDSQYVGYTWAGQVRSDHTDATSDATFTFGTTEAYTDNGVTRYRTAVTLNGTQTRALADLIVEDPPTTPQYVKINGTRYTLSSVTAYQGVWDIEITQGSNTRTIVQGTITIDQDVTRS